MKFRELHFEFVLGVLPFFCIVSIVGAQQPDPNSPRYKGVVKLVKFIDSEGDKPLKAFLKEQIADSLKKKHGEKKLLKLLKKTRLVYSKATRRGARPVGKYSAEIVYDDVPKGISEILAFELEEKSPHRFKKIGFVKSAKSDKKVASNKKKNAPLTWDSLSARLEYEEKNGFYGCVLFIRDGKVVLHRGYGFADKSKKLPVTTETIFGIGSTPIDFTKAAILQLWEKGKLNLSSPITKYFDNVPEGKKGITIEHLMSGQSGLRNFHGLPKDGNPDHTWIDRAEAIRRIMNQKLLFEPGTGREHSHSAWGVLAAIVEIVSGQTYGDYLQKNLLIPAGMTRTGLYQDQRFRKNEVVAIGYNARKSGKINSPLYWGNTSWLVMGSGGMVSTPEDLYKWNQSMRSGKLLNEKTQKKYWGPPGAMGEGGNMFGFATTYNEGPDTMLFVCCNSGFRKSQKLFRDLRSMIRKATAPPYSLAMNLVFDENGAILIHSVVADGAASSGGLKKGDMLISANGKKLNEETVGTIFELLKAGSKIRFAIQRDGKRFDLVVTPRRAKR